METKTFNPTNFLQVSESAEQHLVDQINQNNALGVELGIMPNGCAGFEYTWDYITEYFSQEYQVTQIQDKVLIVNSLSRDLLMGSYIDLLDEGIKGRTLVVKSPKATGTCGCGESVQFDI